jgi:putative transposase
MSEKGVALTSLLGLSVERYVPIRSATHGEYAMAQLPNGRFRKTRRHYDLPNQAHELTFSCYHRLKLLDRDRTRRWFIEALDKARRQLDFSIWAYVIMPDHAHVLVFPQSTVYSTSDIEKAIKPLCARRALNWLRKNRPDWLVRLQGAMTEQGQRYHFWQPGGGYDRNIVEDDTAWASIEYIHMNPVRRGLVAKPTDWLWSSARAYAGMDQVMLEIDLCPIHH